jgi:cytochrome c5
LNDKKAMKKIFLILSFSLFCFAQGNGNMKFQKQNDEASSMPADVNKIFRNSCYDCHTKGGKRMAMSKVNFSDWDSYSQDKKAKKAADIVRMLNKGAMPPKAYRQQHPDRIPTPDQVDLIRKWADSLK